MEEWRDADRDPDRDPGLAADRTTLAWRRSGISVVAVGLAVARGIPTVGGVPGRPLVGLAIVGLGAVAFVVSSVQAGRRAGHAGTHRPAAELADLWPVSAATLFAALGAVVVVLLR
jgi:uncharacterized membrane protein YidH (DUF202 family)